MGRLGFSELLVIVLLLIVLCGGALGIFLIGYFVGKRAGLSEAQQLRAGGPAGN